MLAGCPTHRLRSTSCDTPSVSSSMFSPEPTSAEHAARPIIKPMQASVSVSEDKKGRRARSHADESARTPAGTTFSDMHSSFRALSGLRARAQGIVGMLRCSARFVTNRGRQPAHDFCQVFGGQAALSSAHVGPYPQEHDNETAIRRSIDLTIFANARPGHRCLANLTVCRGVRCGLVRARCGSGPTGPLQRKQASATLTACSLSIIVAG